MWCFRMHLTSVRESLPENVAKLKKNPVMERGQKDPVLLSIYMKRHRWTLSYVSCDSQWHMSPHCFLFLSTQESYIYQPPLWGLWDQTQAKKICAEMIEATSEPFPKNIPLVCLVLPSPPHLPSIALLEMSQKVQKRVLWCKNLGGEWSWRQY